MPPRGPRVCIRGGRGWCPRLQACVSGAWETWAAGARGSSKVRESGLAPRRASSGARPTTTCPCVVGSEEAEPPSSVSSFREAVREEAGRPSAARSCPGEVRAPPGTGRDPRGKRLEEARGPRTTSEVEAVPRTARSDRSVDDIARRTSRAHRHPSSSASRVPLPRLSTYCGAPPGRLGIAEPSSFDLTLGRKYFPVTLLDAPGTPHGRPLPHR